MTPLRPAAARTWLVDQLVERGLTDAVLCPGSRNAPLSFALAAEERVTLHTRIDERTAGFLALGIAKGSRRPVAVVTTSGTAAANLHPAVLEAAHAGVPLVAVTADRPARLRGTGANQTTDQVRLFGDAASFVDLTEPADDALDAAWLPDGPIHLNCQFDDPLLPDPDSPTTFRSPLTRVRRARRRGLSVAAADRDADAHHLPPGPRTVVVAGDDAGPPARALAERAGWPLLAEPSSGSRTGREPDPHLPAAARHRARAPGSSGPSCSATRPCRGRCAAAGPPRRRGGLGACPGALAGPAVPGRLRARPRSAPTRARRRLAGGVAGGRPCPRRRVDAFVAEQPGLTPYDVAAAVNAANPPGGLLFVGASNPIRDLDLMATAHPVGERRMVLANRGLAGIDGTVSSAIGAALGRPHSTRAIAYVGDVTFLHDATALVIGPRRGAPGPDDRGRQRRRRLDLRHPGAGRARARRRPTSSCSAPPTASTWPASAPPPVRRTGGSPTGPSCEHALASPNGGIEVVEAVVRRDNRRELDEQLRALAD